jgi:hypothetical protein
MIKGNNKMINEIIKIGKGHNNDCTIAEEKFPFVHLNGVITPISLKYFCSGVLEILLLQKNKIIKVTKYPIR